MHKAATKTALSPERQLINDFRKLRPKLVGMIVKDGSRDFDLAIEIWTALGLAALYAAKVELYSGRKKRAIRLADEAASYFERVYEKWKHAGNKKNAAAVLPLEQECLRVYTLAEKKHNRSGNDGS